MRRQAVWMVVLCAAALAASPAAAPRPAAGQTVAIAFGVNSREESGLGIGFEALSGRGILSGPGTALGTQRLEPQPDDHGLAPRLTYVKQGTTRAQTYRLVVRSGQWLKSSGRSTLILSVEVYDSTDPDCRQRSESTPGTRGKVVLADAIDGRSSATIDLPCGVEAKWSGDDAKLAVGATLCPQRRTQAALPGCPRKAAAAAGTYVVASSTLTDNPYGKEVTVNPAGSATWDHCCDGAQWKTEYTWRLPTTLVPGKAFQISMSLKTLSVTPPQPLLDQMSALAPGFRQDLQTNYPSPSSAAKTYSVPFAKGYADDPNAKVIKLYVSFAHATVTYTYRRSS